MKKSLGTLLQDLEIVEARGDLNTRVTGITYDSRLVQEDFLFVAIPGSLRDGSQFIRDALERGARAVVCQNAPANGVPVPMVRVRDSRRALAKLAANFFEHPSLGLQLIGVTGTNGKTTTTLLLESILRSGGHRPGVIGTLGYRWAGRKQKASLTTPECLDLQRILFEMRQEHVTHAVMEVSSHALSLGRVDGCVFRAGVFTNLSQDHLDFHGTMEDYFQAKQRLFSAYLGPRDQGSTAIVNADDPYGKRLMDSAGKARVWSYSMTPGNADVSVLSSELSASGIRASLATPAGEMEIRSPLLGRLNLYNLLAAASTALALGIPEKTVASGLQSVDSVDGRLQRVPIPEGSGFEVVVDYAHTPDAMDKSLNCLKEMTKGRLLVVFGCGGDRDRGKRPLMGEVAGKLGDLVVITSDNPRSEAPDAIIREIEAGARASGLRFFDAVSSPRPDGGFTIEVDRRRAIELALSWARPGDMLFIGGKGHETYQIIGDRVLDFDDRVVVREYFQRNC
jgi:UDP-N-acetylmuramoyl-L-alanyl-D-glutamate--2,6-diaminopimelate ligase